MQKALILSNHEATGELAVVHHQPRGFSSIGQ